MITDQLASMYWDLVFVFCCFNFVLIFWMHYGGRTAVVMYIENKTTVGVAFMDLLIVSFVSKSLVPDPK